MNSASSTMSSPRISRKAYIPPKINFSKYSEERPKGKIQGLYSCNSSNTFDFRNNGTLNKNSSKKLFHAESTMNPILQETCKTDNQVSGKKIISSLPSPSTVYASQRKFNLPSELGIGNRYNQYYNSSVFKDSKDSYLFNGKTKTLLSKNEQVSSLLRYDYALPYKEVKITSKIGTTRD